MVKHLANFIAKMDIRSNADLYNVTQAHVIAYREILRDEGMSKASIANRLPALSSLYKFLTDKQLCKFNPVSGVRYPKTGHNGLGSGKTPTLSSAQVRAMLDAPNTAKLQGLRDRAILHIFFYTGGRCSEPGALKVKDFRMDREYWVLEMTIRERKPTRLRFIPSAKLLYNDTCKPLVMRTSCRLPYFAW